MRWRLAGLLCSWTGFRICDSSPWERGEWQTTQQIGTKDPRWKAVRTCQLPSSLLAIGYVLLSTSSVLITVPSTLYFPHNHPVRWGFSRGGALGQGRWGHESAARSLPMLSGSLPGQAGSRAPLGPTGLFKNSWLWPPLSGENSYTLNMLWLQMGFPDCHRAWDQGQQQLARTGSTAGFWDLSSRPQSVRDV